MSRLLALLALLVPACFSPSYPSGGFPCGPAGECPSDFHCSAQLTCVNGTTAGADAAMSLADAPVATADAPVATDAAVLPDAPITTDAHLGADAQVTTPDAPVVPPDAQPDAHPVDARPPADAAPTLVNLQLVASGPGALFASPSGPSCGQDCFQYTVGAVVTVTARATTGFSITSWTGGGCEPVGDGPCSVVMQRNTEVDVAFCRFNKVVDPNGVESNPGTCAKPLKTISHAIDLSAAGDLIGVNPGTYSAASGEFFPIIVPENVSLIGDEAHHGSTTTITGGDVAKGLSGITTTLQPQQGSVVAGFTITNAAAGSSMGVVVTEQSVTLRNNTITNCAGSGVYLPSAAHDMSLIDNAITNNAHDGVAFFRGGLNSVVEGNTFAGNNFGVEVDACADCIPDLGGGAAGSTGGNTFVCNTSNDFWTNVGAAQPISAKSNRWDHAPPSTGCNAGQDVCAAAPGGLIDTTGATLGVGACP